jgi:mono/diheme cytochrome c family protein
MIKTSYKKAAVAAGIALGTALIIIQFIPSSVGTANPPVTGEPSWDAPETRATFMTACADCHSNETRYPWYSSIAPASWLIERDIQKGRKHFNISEWDRSQRGGEDAADEVQRGAMPIGPYLLMHPDANLTVQQKQRFVSGLMKTFGSEPGRESTETDTEPDNDRDNRKEN